MKAPDANRQIEEFCALLERQRRFIVKSDRTTNDAISAEIILESLLVSLFLCMNDRPQRPVAAGRAGNLANRGHSPQVEASAKKLKSAQIVLFPRIARQGGKNSMASNSMASLDGDRKKKPSQTTLEPEFRPLSLEEQNEFMNSLSAEAKKLLADLGSKKRLPKPAVASEQQPRPLLRLL